MILRNWHYLLFLLSLCSISTAFIAEFLYSLQPCELCLKQRHPYYFFIVILFCSFFVPKPLKFYFFLLIQFAVIYGIYYSVWHVGVENGMIPGPSGCSSGLSLSNTVSQLKEQILNKQVISCDEVIWTIFGISAASINTIVLLFIFVINALYTYKLYVKK